MISAVNWRMSLLPLFYLLDFLELCSFVYRFVSFIHSLCTWFFFFFLHLIFMFNEVFYFPLKKKLTKEGGILCMTFTLCLVGWNLGRMENIRRKIGGDGNDETNCWWSYQYGRLHSNDEIKRCPSCGRSWESHSMPSIMSSTVTTPSVLTVESTMKAPLQGRKRYPEE